MEDEDIAMRRPDEVGKLIDIETVKRWPVFGALHIMQVRPRALRDGLSPVEVLRAGLEGTFSEYS